MYKKIPSTTSFLFRIRSVGIGIDSTSLILIPLFLAELAIAEIPFLPPLLALLCALLIHELGHIITLAYLGVKCSSLTITPYGGNWRCIFELSRDSAGTRLQQIPVTLENGAHLRSEEKIQASLENDFTNEGSKKSVLNSNVLFDSNDKKVYLTKALKNGSSQREGVAFFLSGTAMNLLIAFFILGFIEAEFVLEYLNNANIFPSSASFRDLFTLPIATVNFLRQIALASVILGGINLIPAFPLDGARLLAMLMFSSSKIPAPEKVGSSPNISSSMSSPVSLASVIRVNQLTSICIGLVGIFLGSLTTIGLGVLTFIASIRQYVGEVTAKALAALTVKDVMCPRSKLDCFFHGTTLESAIRTLMKSPQDVFPVLVGDNLVGLIDRATLLRATVSKGDNAYITELVERRVLTTTPDQPLSILFYSNLVEKSPLFVVVNGNEFLGFVYPSKLTDIFLAQSLHAEIAASEEDDF